MGDMRTACAEMEAEEREKAKAAAEHIRACEAKDEKDRKAAVPAEPDTAQELPEAYYKGCLLAIQDIALKGLKP